MSHYSNSPNKCRVDFFKPSGKWYATEEINWPDSLYEWDIHRAFLHALSTALSSPNGKRYSDMTAVCLEPYHKHAYPLMIINWGKDVVSST